MNALIKLKVLDLKVSSIIFNSSLCTAISPNGLFMANEEWDTDTFFIKIFKTSGPEQMKVIVSEDQFIDFYFTPDSRVFVCVTSKEMQLYTLHMKNRSLVWTLKKKVLYSEDNAVRALSVSDKHIMVTTALGIYVYTKIRTSRGRKFVLDVPGISTIGLTDKLMAYADRGIIYIYEYLAAKGWTLIKKVVANDTLYTSIALSDNGLCVFATGDCELHTCNIYDEGIYNTISIPNIRQQYSGSCLVQMTGETLVVSNIYDEKSAGSIWYMVHMEGRWRFREKKITSPVVGERFGKKVSITSDGKTLLVLSDRNVRICRLL